MHHTTVDLTPPARYAGCPPGRTAYLLLPTAYLLLHTVYLLLRNGTQRPRSRPMSSFMISLEPAQILVTRASRQARATRYSFMKP